MNDVNIFELGKPLSNTRREVIGQTKLPVCKESLLIEILKSLVQNV